MVSMAKATLGKPGLLVAWISYLCLLYTLLSAYISGGADVLGGLLQHVSLTVPSWQLTLLFTLGFGAVVYSGIRQVDLLNRGLMFTKLGVYVLLIVLIAPHIEWSHWQGGEVRHITSSVMILITSFGFAIIIPSLRDYFNDHLVTLRKVILIGSVIPLLCYLAWDAVILGSLPSQGTDGLIALRYSDHATSSLANMVANTIKSPLISHLFHTFTSICMLTAFLGVSLCLISFLGDGLNLKCQGRHGLRLFLLTFAPPLLAVIYFPGAYLYALDYAGYCCVILLLLLPAMMSYAGRKKYATSFIVPGGAFSQWFVMIGSVVLIVAALWGAI